MSVTDSFTAISHDALPGKNLDFSNPDTKTRYY